MCSLIDWSTSLGSSEVVTEPPLSQFKCPAWTGIWCKLHCVPEPELSLQTCYNGLLSSHLYFLLPAANQVSCSDANGLLGRSGLKVSLTTFLLNKLKKPSVVLLTYIPLLEQDRLNSTRNYLTYGPGQTCMTRCWRVWYLKNHPCFGETRHLGTNRREIFLKHQMWRFYSHPRKLKSITKWKKKCYFNITKNSYFLKLMTCLQSVHFSGAVYVLSWLLHVFQAIFLHLHSAGKHEINLKTCQL